MKSSKNDQTITLLVDPTSKEGNKHSTWWLCIGISNENFINFAERYIDQYDLRCNRLWVQILMVELQSTVYLRTVSLLYLECPMRFSHTGVTFRNTPIRGLEVSPYLNRLVCSNGMTSTAFSETYGLHQLNDKSINEFNEHMISMASTGFQPIGLADKIKSANQY